MVASVETRPVTRGLLLLMAMPAGVAADRNDLNSRSARPSPPSILPERDLVRRRANYTATAPLAKSEWMGAGGQVHKGAIVSRNRRRWPAPPEAPGFTLKPRCAASPRAVHETRLWNGAGQIKTFPGIPGRCRRFV